MPKYYNVEYKDMPSILKECEGERFKVSHFDITSNDFYALFRDRIPIGHYVRLTDKLSHECVMSDTRMEKCTNSEFVEKAHGDVLIGGLGIGMIILAIQDNPEVTSITVVEKYQEVVDLIAHQLPLNDKVKIVVADIFEYETEQKFNTIYLDIWNSINRDVWEEQMSPLRKRYRKMLVSKKEDSDRFINCWAYEIARDEKDW